MMRRCWLLTLLLFLGGALPAWCEQAPKPVKVFAWRLQPANLILPGYAVADFHARVKEAGQIWSYYANVKIVEATAAQRPNWIIRLAYRPGAWATTGLPYINISTWPPNLREFAKMNYTRKGQHVRSLVHHEMAHAMGCPGSVQLPQQQRVWLVRRYGPPVVKAVGPIPEVEALPSVSKGRVFRWFRGLLRRG